MWKTIKRWWRYLGAKLGMKLEESADPKVQLEQAIREARDQHRKLTEQAANVIANQKQTQLKLDRAIEEYEKANASARQALLLSDQETRAGNADKARRAVEALTSQIVAKLLHQPTVRMKEAAAAADGVLYADAVRHLFGLGDDADQARKPRQ